MSNNLSINTQQHESVIVIHDQTQTETPSLRLSIVELDDLTPNHQLTHELKHQTSDSSQLVEKRQLSAYFWKILVMNVILAIVMGVIVWQITIETQLIDEIKSHEVETSEQLLSVTMESCGQLFRIGYKTNQGNVFTRDLIYECPIDRCSCDVYSDQWIMKQTLYRIYYQDDHPTEWSRQPSRPRIGQIVGLLIGISVSGFFFLVILCWLVQYCCRVQTENESMKG